MKLILHADDFGMNAAVNDGIVAGFADGLLTSTSLLANAPRAAAAIELWKELEVRRQGSGLPSQARRSALGDPDRPFDLGVHLNLTQGRPMTAAFPAVLLDAHGRFPGVFTLFGRLLRHGSRYRQAIEAELSCQIDFLTSHSIQPTHLNGHQYCEMLPVVSEIVPRLLNKHKIGCMRTAVEWHWQTSMFWQRLGPAAWLLGGVKQVFARRFRASVDRLQLATPDAFLGSMVAGRVDLQRIAAFVRKLKSAAAVEIGLHPGVDIGDNRAEPPWRDPLARLRPGELAMLKSEELHALLLACGATLGRMP